MKTFKQFNEGLVGSALKALGKTKLIDVAKIGAGTVAVKKGLDYLSSKGPAEKNKKKKFDPVGDARKKYQDKKATEYEKKSGTSKEDGYFR